MNVENHLTRNLIKLILIIITAFIIIFGYRWVAHYDEGNRKYEEATVSMVINNANFCLAEYILNPSMMGMDAVYLYCSEKAENSIDEKSSYLGKRVASVIGENSLRQKRARQQRIAFNFENNIQITDQVITYKWFQPDRATVWTVEQWKGEKTFHKYSLKFFEDGDWKIVNL